MGASNEGKAFIKESIEKAEQIGSERKNLENNILKEQINKRKKIDLSEKNTSKNNNYLNKKFDLNILIYSNENISSQLMDIIYDYNKEIFNWKIKTFVGFSLENSQKIIDICEKDFKEKTFKNVLILPIISISNFMINITKKGEDFLELFNKLTEEQQCFFLIIDKEKNDFEENKIIINLKDCIDEDNKKDNNFMYKDFIYKIFSKIILYKRIDLDFELVVEFEISKVDQINILYEYILKKRNNKNDNYFDVFVNGRLFYVKSYNTENIDIQNQNIFESLIMPIFKLKNLLKITLKLYNANTNEPFYYYKKFGINQVKFYYYKFKTQKLKHLLNNKKYEYIDKRNFDIIGMRHSPSNKLLKYVGYYNQLGDVILYENINFYIAKINIAVGGFIGSGKSTLINTILGEKRSLEGKGGSMTNYISQFYFKNYPINLIDFPGFRAKRNGIKNTSLFVQELERKISDLKEGNEVIHCFLFCIKYEERIFDENDEDIKEVFDAIIRLKIRTFFIITESEKRETREFQDFRKIIVNNLMQVKKKYPEETFDRIFGKDLNENIIPILSKNKKYHGTVAEAFGLDEVFEELYGYFLPKRIDYEKKLFLDEEKLNAFIQNNELLKIFESKRKLSEDLKIKIKIEIEKVLMKFFLKCPKYLYNLTEENLLEIIKEIIDHGFNIFVHYINQKSSLERFKFLKSLGNFDNKEMIKVIINEETLKYFEKDLKEKRIVDDINNSIPWYFRVFFPILSPVYYLLGTPIIKIFSGKIADFFMKEVMEVDNIFYDIYFQQLIFEMNNAINSLDKLSKYFNEKYAIKRFENKLIIIFIEEEISETYFNDLKKVSTKLILKGIEIFDKMKDIYDVNISFISSNEKKAKINQYFKKIVLILKNITENKITTRNINDFKKQFREKYGILKKDIPEDMLEELLKKKGFDERRVIQEILNELK